MNPNSKNTPKSETGLSIAPLPSYPPTKADPAQDARLRAFYPGCDLGTKSFTRSGWFRVWCKTHKVSHFPGRATRNE